MGVIDDNNGNFIHKLLLTNIKISKIHKDFANGSKTNIKFSKTHLSKMIQLGGFGPFTIIRGFLNPEEQMKSGKIYEIR